MMAFFLLLWLISMTTPEQKKGLADYFAPASVSETNSGAGGVLAGRAYDTDGAKTSDSVTDELPGVSTVSRAEGLATLNASSGREGSIEQGTIGRPLVSQRDMESSYDGEFAAASASIRQAWQALPEITQIENNLLLQETPEGLNIVIMDQAGRRMFPEGSRYPYEETRQAIVALAPVLRQMPNPIRISGHTAAGAQYLDPNYGAWELSSDRATTVRAMLGEFGVPEDHFNAVEGRATSQPLFPNEPYLASNGRVEITLMTASPPVPPGFKF
jgi:chemotaxis protein MotB